MAVSRIVAISFSFFVALLLGSVVCVYLDVPTFFVLEESNEDQVKPARRVHTGTDRSGKNHVIIEKINHKSKATKLKSTHNPLSVSVADQVKTFVFFLGHPRSGHSIVGSLLDAHPHVVIANEADVFSKLLKGQIIPNKYGILNTVWTSSLDGLRLTNSKGYRLFVDGLFEGAYSDYIDVMGDKKAGVTTQLLLHHSMLWKKAFSTLKSHFDFIKVIHVIRNPYDNIATEVFYHIFSIPKFADVKKNNETLEVRSSIIQQHTVDYFACHKAIVNAQQIYQLDILEVHGRDLIDETKETMMNMCSFLGVNCSHNYLEICSNKVFKSESKTRHLIKWTNNQIKEIQASIEKYSSLKRYTFNS